MCSRPGHVVFSVLPSSLIDHGFKTWSCGVMVSVHPSCAKDHVFKTWLCGVMLKCASFECDRS